MATTGIDSVNRNKDLFYEALVVSMGVVTAASEACNLSRTIHYQWLQEDKEYKKRVEGIQGIMLDMAESALFSNIKAKKSSDVQFYLKTKGSERGYAPKIEVTGKDGGALQINAIFGQDLLKVEDAE
ncbi:MAG: hypothetical protein KAU20_03560 [Nanoarchaeota archaeon]|nr:hypothetical protein [Nanoarchaeota archaeon]